MLPRKATYKTSCFVSIVLLESMVMQDQDFLYKELSLGEFWGLKGPSKEIHATIFLKNWASNKFFANELQICRNLEI